MIHLRFDDITPTSNNYTLGKILKAMSKLGVSGTFGIVPDNQDAKLMVAQYSMEIIEELAHMHKSEPCIAMHGYQHVYQNNEPGILGFPHKSEFANLPHDLQEHKISVGLKHLYEWNIEVDTFFAPSHSFCRVTIDVLKDLEFKFILDGWGGVPYQNFGLTFLPQQMGGLKRFPFGVSCHCFHVDSWCDLQVDQFLRFIELYCDQIISLSEYQKLAPKPYRQIFSQTVHRLGRKFKNA